MEMVVVLAVFSTTSLIAVDLFMTITNVQRQVRNVQAVQSDARFAIESIAQAVKLGTIDYDYYQAVCSGGNNPGDPCPNGNECVGTGAICDKIDLSIPINILATKDQDNNQIFYKLNGQDIEVCSNTYYEYNRCNLMNDQHQPENNWQKVTPSGVKVTDLKIYVMPFSDPFAIPNECTVNRDCDSNQCVDKRCVIQDKQPAVTILLETVSNDVGYEEKVNLQTTVTSMIYRR